MAVWGIRLRLAGSLTAVLLLCPEGSVADSSALAWAPERSFSSGERLTYSLSWLGIQAGTAVMAVEDVAAAPDRPMLRLTTIAQSNAFISVFYPVDNRVESVVDAERMAPQRLVFKRREGKRKNDYDFVFHHEAGTVTMVKDGKGETLPILPETQDILSCLYYFRNLRVLRPGTSVMLNVHHDRKNYRLEVKVEGVERLQGPWKSVEAVRVLAVMPFRGIFLNEGNVRVWLTNDARHIPLMMKAKVIIGSVVARLVDGWVAVGPPPL